MKLVLVSAASLVVTACGGHRGWFALPDARSRDAAPERTAVALEERGSCPGLSGSGPVVVLVHGIGGETQNVRDVRAVLERLEPAALLSFHWSAVEETRALVTRFAGGLSHLARCAGDSRPIVVLAHSAGGVLSAMAVSELTTAEAAHDIVLVTVASPLGGAGFASWRLNLLPAKPFVLTLGGRFEGYPAPAPGVRVVHVRTHPASDAAMRQIRSGHFPDDPRAVVPGSREHALPVHVDHDDALLWAARALAETPAVFGLEDARRLSD
ncbi:MAG: hypothetical protein JNK82_14930 [Myxococcaceae bacterium]|nr:hypothetical protein [Myxococcaceae bacterium]